MKFSPPTWHWRSRNFLLGVDISPCAIRLVELSHSAGQYHLENYAVGLIEPVTENLTWDQQAVSTLQTILQKTPVKSRVAVTAVPSNAVMTKVLQLDRSLNEMEIAQHIFNEAEQYFQQSVHDICWDFSIMSPSQASADRVDVRVVAAWRREVEARVNILQRAGLQVKAVDMEALALARAIKLISNYTTNIFIHLDVANLLFGIVVKNNLIAVHAVNLSGDLSDPVIVAEQIAQQWRLFISNHEYANPEQIFLSGDKIKPILAELIAAKMQISTQIAKPFTQDTALMVACGLALWCFS